MYLSFLEYIAFENKGINPFCFPRLVSDKEYFLTSLALCQQ